MAISTKLKPTIYRKATAPPNTALRRAARRRKIKQTWPHQEQRGESRSCFFECDYVLRVFFVTLAFLVIVIGSEQCQKRGAVKDKLFPACISRRSAAQLAVLPLL